MIDPEQSDNIDQGKWSTRSKRLRPTNQGV
jgi:hypothetical protein